MLPLKFIPIYFERVWGGRELETRLGRALPPNLRIGESREITDRPEAVSIIADGEFKGLDFRQTLKLRGEEIMGPGWERSRRFPLIVKWLDCSRASSLQVHPTAETAKKFGGEAKTEAWFFFSSAPGATVYAGLKPEATPEKILRASEDGSVESLIERLEIRTGDCLLLESGTVHAAGAGNLILEIQQSSDTTFRLFDWNRLDAAGFPRRLHVAESVESIRFPQRQTLAPRHVPAGSSGELCACGEFSMRKLFLPRGARWEIAAGEQPRIVAALDGEVSFACESGETSILPAETVLVPWATTGRFTAERDTQLIITENFHHRQKPH